MQISNRTTVISKPSEIIVILHATALLLPVITQTKSTNKHSILNLITSLSAIESSRVLSRLVSSQSQSQPTKILPPTWHTPYMLMAITCHGIITFCSKSTSKLPRINRWMDGWNSFLRNNYRQSRNSYLCLSLHLSPPDKVVSTCTWQINQDPSVNSI